MSLLEKYTTGWGFRSARPDLEVGDDVDVFVSEMNGESGLARIGDTKLYVEGVEPEHVERRIRVRITEYDPSDGVGRGEFREVVGESSYNT